MATRRRERGASTAPHTAKTAENLPTRANAIQRGRVRRSDLASLCSWLVALGLVAPARASAEEASASGSLGAGMFGTGAAASAELGVDVSGEQYALGIGGRLRWVADEGVRTRDWDEPSEWATLVRYLMYTRAPADPDGDSAGGGVGVAAVMGQLGGVSLGHGALIQGYTTGLDVDHARLGAQMRVARGSLGLEGLIDDVIAPRVAGVRGSWQHEARNHALSAGVSTAADFTAPRTVTAAGMPMPMPRAMIENAFLPMVAVDGSVGLYRQSPGDSPGPDGQRRIAGTLHAELAAISTVAAGLHLGLTLEAGLGRARLWGHGAVSVGTAGYVPGWVGPMYERDRVQLGEAPGAASQLDRATAGGLGDIHLGGRIAAGGRHEHWGEVELAYAQRPGLPDLATARLAAPYFRDVQGALWGAVETGETTRGQARVLALELRARLPRGLFITAEAARLYRAADDMTAPPGALAPWWLATLALGATIDLDRGLNRRLDRGLDRGLDRRLDRREADPALR
jgi:hypothetical protein